MRRLAALLSILLVGAGCADTNASTFEHRVTHSEAAVIEIAYVDAEGAELWTISQRGPEYISFTSATEKFISTPDGHFDCVRPESGEPTCTEVDGAELEFALLGPATVVGLENTIEDNTDALLGAPVSATIAKRGALCYRVDADALLEGAVDDPDARVCFERVTGWILEASLVDTHGGLFFRAAEVGAPDEYDFELPVPLSDLE